MVLAYFVHKLVVKVTASDVFFILDLYIYIYIVQHEVYLYSSESPGIVMVLDQTVMSAREDVVQDEVLVVEAVAAEAVAVDMTIVAKENLIVSQDLIKRK